MNDLYLAIIFIGVIGLAVFLADRCRAYIERKRQAEREAREMRYDAEIAVTPYADDPTIRLLGKNKLSTLSSNDASRSGSDASTSRR